MAHRILHQRHHILGRQFSGLFNPGVGGNGGSGDNTVGNAAAAPVPTVNTQAAPAVQPTVTTPTSNQPTAVPIIKFPGDDGNSPNPPVQATTQQQPQQQPVASPQPATTPQQQPTQAVPQPVSQAATTTPVVAVSTAAPETVLQTTTTPLTTPLTNALTVSRTPTSSASSSSSSSAPQSSSHIGPVIGGVAAGLAGVIVLVFAITYFVRRKRAKQYEQDAFDAAQFRRSAVLMDDPPTHDDVMARGFHGGVPPPLDMSMQHHGYGGYPAPVSYNNLGGHHNNYDAEPTNSAGFGASGTSRWSDLSPPPTAISAQPFIPGGAGYGGGHPSPLPSPISPSVSPYESVYNQTGLGRDPSVHSALSRQPSGGALSAYPAVGLAVTREPSVRDIHNNPVSPISPPSANTQYANYPTLNPSSPRHSVPMPQNDYVDLSRSSVTPFQAAQYQAISNRLNAPPPTGLDNGTVEEHLQRMSPPPLSHTPMVSPFDDPVEATKRASGGSVKQQAPPAVADFPAPPPPAALPVPEVLTPSSRVTSIPPMLPEINVQGGRITSMDISANNGQEVTPATPSPMASSFIMSPYGVSGNGNEQMFPATPSAVHESFSVATTPVKKSFEHSQQSQGHGNMNVKRPDTLYDMDDAYGGM